MFSYGVRFLPRSFETSSQSTTTNPDHGSPWWWQTLSAPVAQLDRVHSWRARKRQELRSIAGGCRGAASSSTCWILLSAALQAFGLGRRESPRLCRNAR